MRCSQQRTFSATVKTRGRLDAGSLLSAEKASIVSAPLTSAVFGARILLELGITRMGERYTAENSININNEKRFWVKTKTEKAVIPMGNETWIVSQ